MSDLPLGAKLWIENGEGAAKAHLVRPDEKPYLALIGERRQRAIDVRLVGSGETRTVPIGELVEAAPLTAEDEAEYQRLDAELAASTRGEAQTFRRFNGLRLRWLMFGGVPIDSVQVPA